MLLGILYVVKDDDSSSGYSVFTIYNNFSGSFVVEYSKRNKVN